MPILGITTTVTGLVGVSPRIVYILTNDTTATVTATGYLNHAVQEGFSFTPLDMALVNTTDNGGTTTWYQVTHVAANWSLVTVADNIIGNLTVSGFVHAGTSVNAGTTMTAGTGITSTTGNITASAGNIVATLGNVTAGGLMSAGTTIAAGTNIIAGSATPTAGTVTSFPAASGGANDKLVLAAVTTGGNFTTTISNGAMGQSSAITIPDPGAATANFLLDAGAGNTYTDASHLLPIQDMMLAAGGGTWTLTRSAQGDWRQIHSAAADTSILGFDITDFLRAAAAHGFELTSFDVSYSIGTLALNAHSITLNKIVYANNLANAITQPAITSALATATQAQPYLTNSTVNAPAFLNPAAGTAVKYVLELTVNAAATSDYSLQGINLRFTRTVK